LGPWALFDQAQPTTLERRTQRVDTATLSCAFEAEGTATGTVVLLRRAGSLPRPTERHSRNHG
jgi:hypothetical protein